MKNMKFQTRYIYRAFALLCVLTLTACGGGGGGGSTTNSGNNNGGDNGGENNNGDNNGSSGSVQVSGSIQGMTAENLALSNGGANKTEFDEDGRFSFSVAAGKSYSIIVEANPLEQLCVVDNGSGENITQEVTNVIVRCESVARTQECRGNTDSDGDTLADCLELERYQTNPWLADTDGDGFDDGREAIDYDPNNNRFVFNPLVADMAKISIDLTGVPEIDLDFTESSGQSRTVGTQYESSESNSISNNWGGEVSRQLETGHTLSVSTTQTVGTEVNVSLTDLGGSASFESSLTAGFETSVSQTRGSSVNWSETAASENSRAYTETMDITEEEGSTYNGGFLRVTAKVINEGHIPYDLENLTLSAFLFDPKRPFDVSSIGTLEFSNGGFPATTVLSGETAPLNFSTQITLGKAQDLLRDSDNLVVTPGTYRLLDINDKSLLLVDRDVSARTATVTIDYGIDAAREEKFRVAINRGDGTRTLSLQEALRDVAGLELLEGNGQWIYGDENTVSTTQNGLLALGDFAMSADNNRYWLIAHNRNQVVSNQDRITDYYNILQEGYALDDIVMRAGDKITLVYVGDSDRDGVSDRLERTLRTDRQNLDTDDDGLNDGLEVYGWLSSLSGDNTEACDEGDNLTRVFANPLKKDSDDDGKNDFDERADCENPSFDFIAEAGDEQFVNRGSRVTLFANIEGTTTGTPMYRWLLVSGPDVIDGFGDKVRELEGRQPEFIAPDEVSTLVWELSATLEGVTQLDRTHIQVQEDRQKAVYVGVLQEGEVADGTREFPNP